MFNAKRMLPRRTVLRGLGTALALPFLESMVPSFTAFAQSAAAPPLRFGGIYLPNGMPIKDWMPTTTERMPAAVPTVKMLIWCTRT